MRFINERESERSTLEEHLRRIPEENTRRESEKRNSKENLRKELWKRTSKEIPEKLKESLIERPVSRFMQMSVRNSRRSESGLNGGKLAVLPAVIPPCVVTGVHHTLSPKA